MPPVPARRAGRDSELAVGQRGERRAYVPAATRCGEREQGREPADEAGGFWAPRCGAQRRAGHGARRGPTGSTRVKEPERLR